MAWHSEPLPSNEEEDGILPVISDFLPPKLAVWDLEADDEKVKGNKLHHLGHHKHGISRYLVQRASKGPDEGISIRLHESGSHFQWASSTF